MFVLENRISFWWCRRSGTRVGHPTWSSGRRQELVDLKIAHSGFHAARTDDGLGQEISWIAAIAVAVGCQREMEMAGIFVRSRYMPSISDAAREARWHPLVEAYVKWAEQ